MREISLIAVPSQELSLTLDGVRYVLHVTTLAGVMGVTITADDAPVVTSAPMLAGEMLIPYKYLESGGNFMLTTLGGALPDWQSFGATQQLFYLSASDLEAIRG